MSQSEVARLKQQIQREYEAAQQALTGLSLGTARHAFIIARMENVQRAHEQLAALVRPEEAAVVLAQTAWKPDDVMEKMGERGGAG